MRTVDVTPYVLARTARDYTVDGASFDEAGEIGGDAKIQVTQGLTLDLTYNTDFAQVEVDDAQTNLTRFSLFFPEKRPFFPGERGPVLGRGGAIGALLQPPNRDLGKRHPGPHHGGRKGFRGRSPA